MGSLRPENLDEALDLSSADAGVETKASKSSIEEVQPGRSTVFSLDKGIGVGLWTFGSEVDLYRALTNRLGEFDSKAIDCRLERLHAGFHGAAGSQRLVQQADHCGRPGRGWSRFLGVSGGVLFVHPHLEVLLGWARNVRPCSPFAGRSLPVFGKGSSLAGAHRQ